MRDQPGGGGNAVSKKLVLPTEFTNPGGPLSPEKWYVR